MSRVRRERCSRARRMASILTRRWPEDKLNDESLVTTGAQLAKTALVQDDLAAEPLRTSDIGPSRMTPATQLPLTRQTAQSIIVKPGSTGSTQITGGYA